MWDADGEEVRKTLDDSSSYNAEWTLIEDDMCVDASSFHLQLCRNWLQLRGFEMLWNVALSAHDDSGV